MLASARYLADSVRFAAIACAALLLASSSAGASTARRAIAVLNAQRAANGLPAGITENPTWSRGCAMHDRYMARNNLLTPTEDPTKPAYTYGGWYAGINAVVSQGTNWDSGNPYESAPLHLDQLLAPRLVSTGSADLDGYGCTTTFPGWTGPDPAALTVYTYPGNGATIYRSEAAHELPETPGQLVGLAATATTGPYLFVFADAPGQSSPLNPATLTDATLSGPGGRRVRIRTVDGDTRAPIGSGYSTLAPFISPGGFIIPVSPLVAGKRYHAHVVVGFAGVQTPHDWSFTAAGADPHSRLTLRRSRLLFASRSRASITISFRRANGIRARGIRIGPGRSAGLPRLTPGAWLVCGDQSPSGGFSPYGHCLALTVTGRPSLKIGAPRVAGDHVRFALHFSANLRGRPATLTVVPLTVRCSHGRCRTHRGHAFRLTFVLLGGALSLSPPSAHHGISVTLATSPFRIGDAPWAGARASRAYARG
jgi:hypothetical protein